MIADKNLKILVISLLILTTIIKLFGLNTALYDDEANFAFAVANADSFGFNRYFFSPIIMQWAELLFVSFLGLKTWVFRLVPLIIGLAVILFTYLLAKEHYGTRAALFAVLLVITSFYHTLASLQFDVEGSFVTLFFLLAVFSFLKYKKHKILMWQILTGLFAGLAIISKYNAVTILAILGIYSLLSTKSILKTISELFLPYLTAVFVFIAYVLLAFIDTPDAWQFVSTHASKYVFNLSLLAPIMLLFWATPLLIGLTIIAILKAEKKDALFLVWIGFIVLFYMFVVTFGDFSRYQMNLIPAMAILGGKILSQFKFKRCSLHIFSYTFILFLAIIFWLNLKEIAYIPRTLGAYFKEISSLNLNFLFSYVASSGPLFGVNFASVALTLIVAFIAMLIYLFIKKPVIRSLSFIIFLAVGFAFNAFLIQEYIFHATQPNVSKVQYEMIEFTSAKNLQPPYYSNDEALEYYLFNDYWARAITFFTHGLNGAIGFAEEAEGSVDIVEANARIHGGTILLLNFPPIEKGSKILKVAEENCILMKTFYSKGMGIGYVYVC